MIRYRSGSPEDDQYAITPSLNSPGIYSGRWGSLRTYQTAWNLVTYIDLNKPVQQTNPMNIFWREVSGIFFGCYSNCEFRVGTSALYVASRALIEERQKFKELIQDYQEFHIAEKERSFFDTLNAGDAKFYDNHIEKLKNDSNFIVGLVEKRTHFIKSQFNEQKIELSNANIRYISEFDKTLSLETKNDKKKFMEAIELLDRSVDQCRRYIAILTNAISIAKKGKLHHQLLPSHQLIQSAKAIERNVPNLQFPVPLENKYASDLLKLSKITIYFSRGNLIYIISLPILDPKSYTVFRNIPLPIYQQSSSRGASFAYIKPNSPFTAICDSKESYYRLDSNLLNDCKVFDNRFICKNFNDPRNINALSDCEVKIIVEHNFQDFATCDIRVRNSAHTYWSRIHLTNQWVYFTASPEKIKIKCENRAQQKAFINGTGILYLPPHCEARTSFVVLTSSEKISRMPTEFGSWVPLNISALYSAAINATDLLNLSELLSNVDSPTPLSNGETQESNASDGDIEFRSIINRAKELSKQKSIEKRMRRLEIAGYSGVVLGSLVIILGIAWKFSLFSQVSCLCSSRLCKKRNCEQNDERSYSFDNQQAIDIIELDGAPPLSANESNTSTLRITPAVNAQGDICATSENSTYEGPGGHPRALLPAQILQQLVNSSKVKPPIRNLIVILKVFKVE